jgi:hypothetical protein
MRYRYQKERLMQELERSPETFDLTNYELPPSISCHEPTQERLVAALEARREEIRMLMTVHAWESANQESDINIDATPFLKLTL